MEQPHGRPTSHSGLNFKGSDGSRLPNVIVVSSAIPQDNVEILRAKSAGVPVQEYNSKYAGLCFERIGNDLTAVIGAYKQETLVDELVVQISKELNRQIVVLILGPG
ncbi:hypothetical protein CFP56_001089 [Quercus suber]|uniref:Uncharacterized protein n=1 Tax=Quercus suber TaxID=58331 RepID=A0AAW0IN55_QUESU